MRQGKIFFRQPAGIVRGEYERNLVPAHINVRVMLRLFRQHRHDVDELHRLGKIREFHTCAKSLSRRNSTFCINSASAA